MTGVKFLVVIWTIVFRKIVQQCRWKFQFHWEFVSERIWIIGPPFAQVMIKNEVLCFFAHNLYCRLNIYKCSAVAEMGDCLAKIDMSRKLGAVPLWRGAGSSSNSMWPGPRPSIRTKCHLDPSSCLATIDTGRKWKGALPLFWGGESRSPSNTMSLGPRPTSIPSGILVHPAISPQQIWAENWGCAPLGRGKLGPHLTQCGQSRGLPACSVLSWSIQPFDHSQRPKVTFQNIGPQNLW